MLLLGNLSAQTISYEIVEDNPTTVRNKFIAVEFLNADIGGNRNLNTVGIGANAVWGLSDKLGLETRFGYALAKDEDLPSAFNFQAGVFVGMVDKTKTKDIKVRIGGDFDTRENKHVYDEKFILVPGTNLNRHGVRGGLYMYKKGYKLKGVGNIPYTLTGIYGGWSMTQKTNLVVQIKGSSDKKEEMPEKPLYYTGFTRVFVDAIVTPVAAQQVPSTGSEGEAQNINKLLGGRIGCQFYKDGPKWFNKFMWGLETGVRPLEGFYFATNVGYSIYRSK